MKRIAQSAKFCAIIVIFEIFSYKDNFILSNQRHFVEEIIAGKRTCFYDKNHVFWENVVVYLYADPEVNEIGRAHV